MQDSWDGLEKLVKQFFTAVKKNLSASERREVEEFINDNEFDAAIEAITDFLGEGRGPLSKSAVDSAKKLCEVMDSPGELGRILKMASK
ncbi:MAG: hypothetical protein DELT_00912 [Desulfovibrio sp.]